MTSLILILLLILIPLLFYYKDYFKNIPRDLHLIYSVGKFMIYQKWMEIRKKTILDIFKNNVHKYPYKIALLDANEQWTFTKLNDESEKVGRFFYSKGFKKGDSVALMMDGSPMYVCIWLGLAKIGCITALINTNQTKDILKRSIQITNSKCVIYSTKFTQVLSEIEDQLQLDFYHIGNDNCTSKSVNLIESLPKDDIELNLNLNLNQKDAILYIYTSGTTGLPKAAIITHARYMMMALTTGGALGFKNNDVIYTSLPLYHSAGTCLGVGSTILGGHTVFIRPKFSASNFFKDCIKYKCTIAQYIGETCRYLLTTPPSDIDRKHNVRIFFGNGLRKDIWKQLVKRFGIKQIGEFYGATEGNSSMINAWNKIGSVGYIPWIVKPFYPVVLIQVYEDTDEPIRDKNGFCLKSIPGQPGLLIGRILTSRSTSHFNGYLDKEATKKKILENVFEQNDKYFNSGDILIQDEDGYMYFRDRTGDTFRWKGENVATAEVEGVVSKIVGNKDSTVYGVEIPGAEGKAGMAAIQDPNKEINMDDNLYKLFEKELSTFSIPIFIRIVEKLPLTGTFKIQKNILQKDGFNINKITDPIYVLDAQTKKYILCDKEIYQKIVDKKMKF